MPMPIGHDLEGVSPVFWDENTIKALKHRIIAFDRPSIEPPLEIKLLKLNIIEELSKMAHHTPVKPMVIFVFGLINQVKIAPYCLNRLLSPP